MSEQKCPCNSKKTYITCCGPYIEHQKSPPTAEALMRSRYTAYTQANIAYIQATMCGPAAESYDAVEAEKWAKTLQWKRLKISRTFSHPTDPNIAYVTFTAQYLFQNTRQTLSETSQFQKTHGRWYYIDSI